MVEERLQIAVFIDFDNISIGVKTSLFRNFDIGAVLEAIKERGEVITKIAYGDWKRADDFSRAMTQYAVQMVQRNVTPRGDKNGADINLALDALEMAFTRNHINAFVIVGGDSDFIALVEKLKQYGKKVFVVGGRAFTSTILQKNCHEFIAYENLVGGNQPVARKAAGRSPSTNGTPLENAVPQVRRALKVLSDREVSPQLGLLKSTLLQLDPTFSERDFGAATFLEFIQKMANAGFVNLKQVDRSWLVELKEPDVAAARPSHRGHPGAPRAEVAPQPAPEPTPQPEAEAGPPPQPEAAPVLAESRPETHAPAAEPVQSGQAIALLRKIFANGKGNVRWPMYLRSFKQLLRAADPSFDEQAFGFGSVYDLVRQAQREGLLRIERNRKGILRIFPGDNFPQAVPEEPVLQEQPPAPVEVPEPEVIEAAVEEVPPESVPELAAEPVAVPIPVEEPAPEPPPRKPRAPRPRKSASTRQPKQKKSAAPRKSRAKKTTETETTAQ